MVVPAIHLRSRLVLGEPRPRLRFRQTLKGRSESSSRGQDRNAGTTGATDVNFRRSAIC